MLKQQSRDNAKMMQQLFQNSRRDNGPPTTHSNQKRGRNSRNNRNTSQPAEKPTEFKYVKKSENNLRGRERASTPNPLGGPYFNIAFSQARKELAEKLKREDVVDFIKVGEVLKVRVFEGTKVRATRKLFDNARTAEPLKPRKLEDRGRRERVGSKPKSTKSAAGSKQGKK